MCILWTQIINRSKLTNICKVIIHGTEKRNKEQPISNKEVTTKLIDLCVSFIVGSRRKQCIVSRLPIYRSCLERAEDVAWGLDVRVFLPLVLKLLNSLYHFGPSVYLFPNRRYNYSAWDQILNWIFLTSGVLGKGQGEEKTPFHLILIMTLPFKWTKMALKKCLWSRQRQSLGSHHEGLHGTLLPSCVQHVSRFSPRGIIGAVDSEALWIPPVELCRGKGQNLQEEGTSGWGFLNAKHW